MTLLGELSVTPQVFLRSAFQSDDDAQRALQVLSRRILEEALARDLRDGEWGDFLWGLDASTMHLKAKDLIRKLREENRLASVPKATSCGLLDVQSETAWLEEALALDTRLPCFGTVVSPCVESKSPRVAKVNELSEADWWDEILKEATVRVARSLPSYRESLRAVLEGARSIMIIDPHAEPESDHYDSLLELILGCRRPADAPLVELHRVRYRGSGPSRDFYVDWRSAFARWSERLRKAGIRVHVYIRSAFHDRFVITDQVGLGLSNGLDLSRRGEKLTISRLSRSVADGVRSDFTRNSSNPRVADVFPIGV